jgi:hypothetical protein
VSNKEVLIQLAEYLLPVATGYVEGSEKILQRMHVLVHVMVTAYSTTGIYRGGTVLSAICTLRQYVVLQVPRLPETAITYDRYYYIPVSVFCAVLRVYLSITQHAIS